MSTSRQVILLKRSFLHCRRGSIMKNGTTGCKKIYLFMKTSQLFLIWITKHWNYFISTKDLHVFDLLRFTLVILWLGSSLASSAPGPTVGKTVWTTVIRPPVGCYKNKIIEIMHSAYFTFEINVIRWGNSLHGFNILYKWKFSCGRFSLNFHSQNLAINTPISKVF